MESFYALLACGIVAILVYSNIRIISGSKASVSAGSGGGTVNVATAAALRSPVHANKIAAPLKHVWRFDANSGGAGIWRAESEPSLAARAAQDGCIFNAAVNPNASDLILRSQLLSNYAAADTTTSEIDDNSKVNAALKRGWHYFSKLQLDSGHWGGDYGGPLFLLPTLVICSALARIDLGIPERDAMLSYLRAHVQIDGGWGLHIEAPSTLFPTLLCYVAVRLLGEVQTAPLCINARTFIYNTGGVRAAPQWAKFYLALIGVIPWVAVDPVPPELWLLPTWMPFAPSRLWCHTRMVYLPMSILYGLYVPLGRSRDSSLASPLPPLDIASALRDELLSLSITPYDWTTTAGECAPCDLYSPPTIVGRIATMALRAWEKWAPRMISSRLRARGIAFALRVAEAEDKATNYLCIGPVSKAIHLVVAAESHGIASPAVRAHAARIPDYLWVAEDGMKMQGYNGSQLWDASFAAQALAAAGRARSVTLMNDVSIRRLHRMIARAQVRENAADRRSSGANFHRDESIGGWPFSTREHGWPIADCTAEGLKAVLALGSLKGIMLTASTTDNSWDDDALPLPLPRLRCAVDILLALGPNENGGWATYERTRGSELLEYLNPAQVFGDIMVDLSYTELTSAAITALAAYSRIDPLYRQNDVMRARCTGTDFIRISQRTDGGWYGSWAACFTYATWFGVEALLVAPVLIEEDKTRLERAATFLLSHQNDDGGWGETLRACLLRAPENNVPSNAVNTAWALLALFRARAAPSACAKGIAWLIKDQKSNGDWPQGPCAGVFNRTCGISYTNYRNVFPLWALAEASKDCTWLLLRDK